MKFCPRCGSDLVPGSGFCHSCGFKLAEEEIPSVSAEGAAEKEVRHVEFTITPEEQTAGSEADSSLSGTMRRAVNILIYPKKEWLKIQSERPARIKLLTTYVLVMVVIPFVLDFITFAFIKSGYSISYAITNSILSLLISVSVVYLGAYISEYLAPSFFAPKNFDRSFQLMCYAFTPVWVSSILTLITGLHIIALFIGFAYMTYLLRTGIPVLKKAADDKATGYAVLMVISSYIIYMVVIKILEAVLF